MRLLHTIYEASCRLPPVRGRSRIQGALRSMMAPTVTTIRGLKMQLDLIDWAQTEILLRDGAEPRTCALFERILRPGDTYLDVGAHVGFHALVARQLVGSTGFVLAVEPLPYNAAKLLVNATLNGFGNIKLVVAAAGATDGSVTLYDQAATGKTRLTLRGAGVSDTIASFEVPLWSLDSVLARRSVTRVRLLKIDVEGYELAVLEGARMSMPLIDNIVFEVLPDMPKVERAKIQEFLHSHGFWFATIDGTPWEEDADLPENNVWARRDRTV